MTKTFAPHDTHHIVLQVVSDAGWGGQVLMCHETFTSVQDLSAELGAVTKDGPVASNRRSRGAAASEHGLWMPRWLRWQR